MSEKSLYVYAPETGEVQYTINNPTPSQINDVEFGHLDVSGLSILEMSVIANTITNQTEMIKLKDMDSHAVIMSDSQFVANGTHTIMISNLNPEATLLFRGDVYTVPIELSETTTVFEINASMVEMLSFNENIKFTILSPKCKPKDYYIPIVKPSDT